MSVLRQSLLTARGGNHPNFPPLIGGSPHLERLRSMIATLSRRTCTVLVCGESGTGKELVARQIHATGPRAGGPFIPVDCTTLREELFESQLFGHVRGAFTGAERATLGLFRAADGGTLFLDEIGELPLAVQAKLLRCIQDEAVTPLGGLEPIPVNVRIIAATHRDLKDMVARAEFREDLYFRLNVVTLEVPPLRCRCDDVVPLARHFATQQAEAYEEPPKSLSADAVAALEAYGWPGNVRELANAVEHAYVLSSDDVITAVDLPDAVRVAASAAQPHHDGVVPLAVAERALIVQALQVAAGNQNRAAEMLQIDRRRLYRKIRQYGLSSLTARSAAD